MNFEQHLLDLRRAFDRSFAEPPPPATGEVEDLVRVRCSGQAYAVRLGEISAVVSGRKIVPLPGSFPEVLGLAGIRNLAVPVYGLGHLLGLPPEPHSEWLLLTAQAPRVALACGEFEGHLRVPRSELVPDKSSKYIQGFIGTRPVIAVAALLSALQGRVR